MLVTKDIRKLFLKFVFWNIFRIIGIIIKVLKIYPTYSVKNKYKKAVKQSKIFFPTNLNSISTFSSVFLFLRITEIMSKIDNKMIRTFNVVGAVLGPIDVSPVEASE